MRAWRQTGARATASWRCSVSRPTASSRAAPSSRSTRPGARRSFSGSGAGSPELARDRSLARSAFVNQKRAAEKMSSPSNACEPGNYAAVPDPRAGTACCHADREAA
eukprot:1850738-Alexandrium_andersonii.AAC.1